MTLSRHSRLSLAAGLISAVLGTTACESVTPYQPIGTQRSASGGYFESMLGDGRYRVSFAGNSLTSRDRVEGYLLYRAAELTLRDGYDWFLIVDRMTEHDTQTYVRPDPFYRPYYGAGYGFWRPHWYYWREGRGDLWHPEWGRPFLDDFDTQTVERFEAHAEIVMQRGTIPLGEERAFDARRVMADLGPTIERPGEAR